MLTFSLFDLLADGTQNACHGSDSPTSAARVGGYKRCKLYSLIHLLTLHAYNLTTINVIVSTLAVRDN